MNYEQLRENLNHALAELKHLWIPEYRVEVNEAPRCTAGGYGDVYTATLQSTESASSLVVAVKELRAVGNYVSRLRLVIHLARELRVWARLKHPNVLELIGYSLNPQMTTARFISPFMANGNIEEYLQNAGPVSDNSRLKLLRDSLKGLSYLHSSSPPICHGDIKPENVLITDLVEAVLCDFGLARLADGQPSGLTTTKTIKGSTRYMSPELLEENALHTLPSDVWAYGCLVLKVMTGSLPYGSAKSNRKILLALTLNQLPAEIADLELQDDKLKTLLRKCWEINPSARPSASECLLHLPEPETDLTASTGMPIQQQHFSAGPGKSTLSAQATPLLTLKTQPAIAADTVQVRLGPLPVGYDPSVYSTGLNPPSSSLLPQPSTSTWATRTASSPHLVARTIHHGLRSRSHPYAVPPNTTASSSASGLSSPQSISTENAGKAPSRGGGSNTGAGNKILRKTRSKTSTPSTLQPPQIAESTAAARLAHMMKTKNGAGAAGSTSTEAPTSGAPAGPTSYESFWSQFESSGFGARTLRSTSPSTSTPESASATPPISGSSPSDSGSAQQSQ